MSLDVIEIVKSTMLPTMAVAVAMATLANVLTARLIKPEKQEEKAKEKLFKLLEKYLSEGGEIDLDFLKYLKSSVEREYQTTISISHILEDFLVHRIEADNKEENSNSYTSELKILIENENQVKPFDSLPSEERRLLKGLRDSVDNNVSPESTYYFIDELSTVMAVRGQEYSRAHQTNKWSVPLAIIGLVFTIIFGLVSMFSGPNEAEIASNLAKQLTQEQKSSNNAN